MAQTTLPLPPPLPLTTFTEDEILFRENIRQFADEKVRPLVREKDEKGEFDKNLIHEIFQLGLMGIGIREHYSDRGDKLSLYEFAVTEHTIPRAPALAATGERKR